MEIAKFRIHGHRLVRDSQWLELHTGLNVLGSPITQACGGLIRALQTINPPCALEQTDPFHDFPRFEHRPTYTRWVIPAKKTAAIAIFNADPAMVHALTPYDQSFYEVDRIEVGRRRDLNRWLNFIEMVNASRWQDVLPLANTLVPLATDGPAASKLLSFIDGLDPKARLHGALLARVLAALEALAPGLDDHGQDLLRQACQVTALANRFALAKEEVLAQLPSFLLLQGDGTLPRGPSLTQVLSEGRARLQRIEPEMADQLLRILTGKSTETAGQDWTVPVRALSTLAPEQRLERVANALILLHKHLDKRSPILLIEPTPHSPFTAKVLPILEELARSCQTIVAPDPALLASLQRKDTPCLVSCPVWQPVP
jgi:hypothetical protein